MSPDHNGSFKQQLAAGMRRPGCSSTISSTVLQTRGQGGGLLPVRWASSSNCVNHNDGCWVRSPSQTEDGRGRWLHISGGHLHTCECLNRSALEAEGLGGRGLWVAPPSLLLSPHKGQFSYVNTQPLPSLGLLWAVVETSHCLNSATQHSCAWASASCCSLAGPAQTDTQTDG